MLRSSGNARALRELYKCEVRSDLDVYVCMHIHMSTYDPHKQQI